MSSTMCPSINNKPDVPITMVLPTPLALCIILLKRQHVFMEQVQLPCKAHSFHPEGKQLVLILVRAR